MGEFGKLPFGDLSRTVLAVARGFRLCEADVWDVVQNTWVSFFRRMETIQDPASLPAWLSTTARRHALALVRRRREIVVPDLAGEAADSETPERVAVLADRDRVLHHAILRLRQPYRGIAELLVRDPVPTYAEIAAELGVEPGTVGPMRTRCLKRLRRLLLAEGIDGW
ncbi:sigma-70 family RNA polymerase sigma factor [Amycolatopsis minnesotensis]|uniref:RNA polymerase sigma-70 region 2 domain-containing protein n=1 Tax=Amycolatopsis minnesotensis TaxID=337894 RepID=A0ABP5DHW3_9PSEU